MEKSFWLIMMFLLCSCQGVRTASCEKRANEIETRIEIEADLDRIKKIELVHIIHIPAYVLARQELLDDLMEQTEGSYALTGSRLQREYEYIPEEEYSFSLTLDKLRKERYLCD